MRQGLEGKSAFVTGAGGGIGRGIAERLAANGASVTIAEINPTTGGATVDALCQAGYSAQFARVDIRSEQDIKAGVAAHLAQYGALDVLVNNAGANQHYDAARMTVDEWERSLSLNLRGAWLCCKHALPIMAAREAGVIVNIASVHATMTSYNFFPYNVAKSGILGLTRSLALDWGRHNIRAVAVSPGWVRTQPAIEYFEQADDPAAEEQRVSDLHPLKRIGEPKNIGDLVAFLASDEASYITGTEIVIDGGITARHAD
ncbi:MAG: glucose 1-dehydrogenase [Chloroflexota bacterium]|nr:glucose 1-dehydrogenase [Chloroflexota bacterium]MDE2948207.1 glucose 1-dehydrogenase [Chloroflexota bacterium]